MINKFYKKKSIVYTFIFSLMIVSPVFIKASEVCSFTNRDEYLEKGEDAIPVLDKIIKGRMKAGVDLANNKKRL
ncbi:MAG: hypothetical protein HQK51_00010, partial [Oligoflexia bacterium]|nr:hypothetical protein [Oligoflexia bacterium]